MKVEKTVVLEQKKVDDVLGGADAWKNVDQTDCEEQGRSAILTRLCKCS